MVNINGTLIPSNDFQITYQNRAFKYGDGIFESIKVLNGKAVFFEDHYFRLMASMRMLRMKIPMAFTLEYLQEEVLKTVKAQENLADVMRVRLTVYRKDGGLYTPATNEVDFVIEAGALNSQVKEQYRIDLYKDFYN